MAMQQSNSSLGEIATAGQPPATPEHKLAMASALGVFTAGAVLVAIATANLFAGVVPKGLGWLAGGGCACAAGLAWSVRVLRTMPQPRDDTERYGRHIVGLTFVLFIVGLCNAVGTSCLAFSGELGFSASAIIEASNPKQLEEADRAKQRALEELKSANRSLAAAERLKARVELEVARECSTPFEASVCGAARVRLTAAEDETSTHRLTSNDSRELVAQTTAQCEETRARSKRALFFLLSISTIMALSGAAFYVVNQVRKQRCCAARADAAEPMVQATKFDTYAFWSGALFRVAEAVLFTFALFWLIWTSDQRTEVVWLPVIALFVGMFVKAGEAIVFRLGMRVLSAVEALLPTSGRGEMMLEAVARRFAVRRRKAFRPLRPAERNESVSGFARARCSLPGEPSPPPALSLLDRERHFEH